MDYMTTTLPELLRQSGVHVRLRARGLAFVPDTGELLSRAVTEEGRELYRDAVEINEQLDAIRAAYSADDWKALHRRATRFSAWPDVDKETQHFNAYGSFVAWVNAGLHVAQGGVWWEVRFYENNLPLLQDQCVGAAVLWPGVRKKVENLGWRA
jgi:hypothetical protein